MWSGNRKSAIMGYEHEKDGSPLDQNYEEDMGILVHKMPKQLCEVSNEDLHKVGLARGRLRGACEGTQNLCYGFVFEEDPTGSEFGPMKDQPTVMFGEDLDVVLPAVVQKLPSDLLIKMKTQYRGYYNRADADSWLGPRSAWDAREQIILTELNRRGIHQYY